MLYGRTSAALPSRFLKELPEDEIVKKGAVDRPKPSYHSDFGGYQPQYVPKKPVVNYQAAVQKQPTLQLSKGDMVQHTAFGRGMVLSVMNMGGDALLEIAFDQLGTKRLMAKSASQHMRKL